VFTLIPFRRALKERKRRQKEREREVDKQAREQVPIRASHCNTCWKSRWGCVCEDECEEGDKKKRKTECSENE
jgi:hypothetical protein